MNRFHLWHMIALYPSVETWLKGGINFILSEAAFLCYGLGFAHWQ